MKYTIVIAISTLFIVFAGCEENFNPIGTYRKEYTMNCVLAENKSQQFLSITQTYQVNEDGSPAVPYDNAVRGATIRLWVEDSVYFFRDTIVKRTTPVTGRWDSVYYYYLPSFTPQKGKEYEVDAVFSYGSRMNSTLIMPRAVNVQLLPAPRTMPVKDVSEWNFYWQANEAGALYVPKLTLEYYVKVNGSWTIRYKDMPIAIVKSGGNDELQYPLGSKNGYVTMQRAALDWLMATVRSEVVNASDIYIERAALQVIICDKNLSSFYQSTVMKADDFSINLEALDFDNINGGRGLYGGFSISREAFLFDWDYLSSYGFAYQKL